MAKMNLTTEAGIKAAIASCAKRGTALKKDLGLIAIAVMEHMKEHGDVTLCQTLCDGVQTALGKNLRRAMEEYLLAYSFAAYDSEKKTFVKDRSKEMQIEEAKKVDWTATERPPVPTPFDAQKSVQSLMRRLVKDGKADDIEALETAFAKGLAEAKAEFASKASGNASGDAKKSEIKEPAGESAA